MKIFLDTANLDQIKKTTEWGLVDGVTTNPTLVSKEKTPFKELIREICRVVQGPVSVESVSTQAEEIVKESRELAKIADNVVVKIPICLEGLKATKELSSEGIK
ncbi:MAG: transaldolase family protein, partial [Acidobacteriota bacterium]